MRPAGGREFYQNFSFTYFTNAKKSLKLAKETVLKSPATEVTSTKIDA